MFAAVSWSTAFFAGMSSALENHTDEDHAALMLLVSLTMAVVGAVFLHMYLESRHAS